ncbi:hypothetical protein BRADI_4g37923v3 [Brachypodium distachyon]|uniref:Uncharacterized protein n=1 Tax=Brachypodium distachyon TaxID=15368 RepID=A0A0Q3HDC1_BRADI|nr:hypothetical protein BRADI_4g37923v3 [Brachypodium distachyon]PNT65140.1 hypothetical protein BRADI_4g37923v3 [Brachypodium distachyon]PNT65141.1 hypothetical protein BRADI_4g37923v3 [Brachypodium distachyon]PNT65142.1 hypothetical protein BRADI_4g37923v3 [Brachypodium distachyon]PNT65143.1 hypothetical protein BRADI_4g37923v3 [Brachypodium distachyon]
MSKASSTNCLSSSQMCFCIQDGYPRHKADVRKLSKTTTFGVMFSQNHHLENLLPSTLGQIVAQNPCSRITGRNPDSHVPGPPVRICLLL